MQDGIVSDSHRVEKIVPTIRNVLKRGGYPILISHFGRPKGKYNSAILYIPNTLFRCVSKLLVIMQIHITHSIISLQLVFYIDTYVDFLTVANFD